MEDKKIRQLIEDGKIDKVPEASLKSYLENRGQISGLPTNAIKYLIYNGMIDKDA